MIHWISSSKKDITTGQTKYYAQIAHITPMTLEDICANITEVCTVTRHDVKSVLSALQSEIIKACQNGQSVRLGDLGSFRPTISSNGAPTAKELSVSAIRSVRCRFVPGSLVYRRLALNSPEVRFGIPFAKQPSSGDGGGGL